MKQPCLAWSCLFGLLCFFLIKGAYAFTVNDSSGYSYNIQNTLFNASTVAIPQMTRTYMVLAAGTADSGTSSCVPIPACPVGWKALVYGTPMQIEGRNLGIVSNGQSPLYPMFGYAVGAAVGGAPCTQNQWQISIYVAMPYQVDTSQPEYYNNYIPAPSLQVPSVPGWAQVTTRCCNPADPLETCM